MELTEFYQTAAGFPPNPLQQAAWEAYYAADGHPALLLRAGTGGGKTEAALLPALADADLRRVVVVQPSKALIEDMAGRIEQILKRLSKANGRRYGLTVDMGGQVRRAVYENGDCHGQTHRRHLFVDDVILTTLDKFLFRMFGYGEKTKSYIFPHRVFGESLGRRPWLIFDEAHDYDGLAFGNFKKLLEALYVKGRDLCVMSATLPAEFADFLETVDAMAGDLGRAQKEFQDNGIISRERRLVLLSAAEESGPPPAGGQLPLFPESPKPPAGPAAPVQRELFESAAPSAEAPRTRNPNIARIAAEVRRRFAPDRRIIARVDTVADLLALWESLQDLSPLVYHGRMTPRQRRKAIQNLTKSQKQDAGFLVLATAAIEAGCDLDAHCIVAELPNPDSLVQLAGRLNRRGQMRDAELVLVGDRVRPGFSALAKGAMATYFDALRNMGDRFSPEDLAGFFQPPRADWMGEVLFDMLWDYVYQADLTCEPLWKRGVLVTRSWEPSVTLCTGLDERGWPENPIQVGLSRLAVSVRKPDGYQKWEEYPKWIKTRPMADYFSIDPDGTWHADLYRAYFRAGRRGEEAHWRREHLDGRKWSAYTTELVCQIRPEKRAEYFHDALGYLKIPRLLRKSFRNGFEQELAYRPERNEKDGCFKVKGTALPCLSRVWYLDRKED
jgi:CRISPR-associated endonuclease/helicase Cas3